jgi:dimethylhistidine N-methyltransferase
MSSLPTASDKHGGASSRREETRAGDDVLPDFARDLLAGLSAPRKHLPPKYFYDSIGSQLFERITELPEYYPTRTEMQILADNAAEIGGFIPEGAALVEFGSGSSAKVRLLLERLAHLRAYVPVDISAEFLEGEAGRLRREFPSLEVRPVAADFTAPFELPRNLRGAPRAGFFPGSTIGNFEPEAAREFLRLAARILGPRTTFIVGVDLVKDRHVLEAAYNDSAGVTAEFNCNVLARGNRELGANFDLAAFEHRAFYDAERSRIEMHLVSRTAQNVRVLGQSFSFTAGESIHTENSYKYTLGNFWALAYETGWESLAVFHDADALFSVHVLQAKSFSIQ